MKYIVVEELLRMGDRFSLGRAERSLLDNLYRMYRWGVHGPDMLQTFMWLGRLEWLRKDYELSRHYLTNAVQLASTLHDNKELSKANIGLANICIRMKELDEAQNYTIDAVHASRDCDGQFRNEIQASANTVFNNIMRARRN